MSKYAPLWKAVRKQDGNRLQLSFDEIEQILGFPIEHAFLTYKKELEPYGWRVEKISMKARSVVFCRTAI
ncbi:MAG: hypothetical protein PHE47_08585 [Oscillospiraceae bacterium]|nr:hypothetical protein [Oscillospiraceae bacterium]